MTIRLAQSEADIASIIALGRAAHEESGYNFLGYDEAKLRASLENALIHPDAFCLLIAEKDGRPVGYLAGVANEYFFSREICATAMVFFVLPDQRRGLGGGLAAVKLLHGFKRWSQNRHARQILINVTTGVDMARTDKLMRRMGFTRTGGNYALELE